MKRRGIHGDVVTENNPPKLTGKEVLEFSGTFNGKKARFGMLTDHLDKHSLLIGSTGCGKTTLMNQIIDQLQQRMTDQDVMIIFDSKGDFHSKFGKRKGSVVIGNSNQYYQQSVRWNIFREIIADGWEDRQIIVNAQEICRDLFAERDKRTNNPFFPNAARDLLASLLIFLVRTGRADVPFRKEYFYNDKLKLVLDTSTPEKILEYLSFDADLQSVASYIKGGGSQADGVLSEMYSIARDVLNGVFAEHGMFSMRQFVREKGGKTLFIEYDLSIGQTLTPVYRLLFDLALKEAMGRQCEEGNVYLICDEFRLLPHLQHIDDGVNFGRSLGVKVFAGLQSIEQLFEIYQESRGRNIAAGFSNLFMFHTDDPSTLKYLTERSGRNVVMDEYINMKSIPDEKKREAYAVEDSDLIDQAPGDAIVKLAFSKPFCFHFQK